MCAQEPPAVVRNFAYGANMSLKKMRQRLELGPEIQGGQIGVLRDFKLIMDFPFSPPTEPAFASFSPSKGSALYGVVYTLTKEQYTELYSSEGGPNDGYTEVEVFPEIIDADGKTIGTVSAMAFKTKSFLAMSGLMRSAMRPSLRYKNILLEGARDVKLPPSYIEELAQIKTARPAGYLMRLMAHMHLCMLIYVSKSRVRHLGWFSRLLMTYFYAVVETLRESELQLICLPLAHLVHLCSAVVLFPFSLIGAGIMFQKRRLVQTLKRI